MSSGGMNRGERTSQQGYWSHSDGPKGELRLRGKALGKRTCRQRELQRRVGVTESAG